MELLVTGIVLLVLSTTVITVILIRENKNNEYLKAKVEESLPVIDGPFGSVIERDDSGQIIYIKDSYGHEYWYKYDKMGHLIEYKNSKGQHHKIEPYKNKRIKIKL